MKFGEKVLTHRLKNNLTQAELADKIGVTQYIISCYERGFKIPNFDTAIRLAKALNVSLDYLADDSKN